MQTYSIEAAKADLSMLVDLAAKGEKFLLTKNDKPLATLGPLDLDEAYMKEIKTLREFAMVLQARQQTMKERTFTDEEIDSYRKRVEALRGSLAGIDTNVERDED